MELKFSEEDYSRLKKLAGGLGINTIAPPHSYLRVLPVGQGGHMDTVSCRDSDTWFVEMMEKIVRLMH